VSRARRASGQLADAAAYASYFEDGDQFTHKSAATCSVQTQRLFWLAYLPSAYAAASASTSTFMSVFRGRLKTFPLQTLLSKFPRLYRNFYTACAVTVVIFGHLSRSFYLLTCPVVIFRNIKVVPDCSHYLARWPYSASCCSVRRRGGGPTRPASSRSATGRAELHNRGRSAADRRRRAALKAASQRCALSMLVGA